uniref:Gibberellin receptor GID1L3 n=1 Tax=Cajanus cajan TaxID=3821 RepID=A0A151TJY4_CAJCA|nr:putative gibberellin receptor GID1L3 [Cajanus cajan]
MPPLLYMFNDGSIERPKDHSRVPPSLEDPATGVSSKDILFSNNPFLFARLYLPKLTQPNQKLSILVYFHGGAFCGESAFSWHHNKYCNVIASEGNVLIVSIEHRKAPEHFLPAAYDDCWAGLTWAASHATPNPTNPDMWLINHADFSKTYIGVYGAYLNHPFFWGSKPIGAEPVQERPQSLLWKFVYPDAPGGLDNPMINPLAPEAPSLAHLGCSKMLVTVAGKDHLHFNHRAVLYYKAVKESGWKGQVELFEEEEEDHVYYMYDIETEQAKKLVTIVANFLRH